MYKKFVVALISIIMYQSLIELAYNSIYCVF